MALSDVDRDLLKRCLAHEPGAWEDLVDRFIGLVLHVVDHTAEARGLRPLEADREDLAAEVFLTLVDNDFAALRRFRGRSCLATYLTVIARRVVVRQMIKNSALAGRSIRLDETLEVPAAGHWNDSALVDREQIELMLSSLSAEEAEVVRLFHLDGRSYQEISRQIGMPENSIGPTLSRARSKMRQGVQGVSDDAARS